jgi:predicted thioesterase
MDFMIPLDISGKVSLIVAEEHTAAYLGSGDVAVFATPMMIALMEAACLNAVENFLPSGWTTVGVKVDVEHLRATPLGESVSAEAILVSKEDRILNFVVKAQDNSGLIGQGTHQRILINRDKFMSKFKQTE